MEGTLGTELKTLVLDTPLPTLSSRALSTQPQLATAWLPRPAVSPRAGPSGSLASPPTHSTCWYRARHSSHPSNAGSSSTRYQALATAGLVKTKPTLLHITGQAACFPGALKGLHKLMLGRPRAERWALSSLGLCQQLNSSTGCSSTIKEATQDHGHFTALDPA